MVNMKARYPVKNKYNFSVGVNKTQGTKTNHHKPWGGINS